MVSFVYLTPSYIFCLKVQLLLGLGLISNVHYFFKFHGINFTYIGYSNQVKQGPF